MSYQTKEVRKYYDVDSLAHTISIKETRDGKFYVYKRPGKGNMWQRVDLFGFDKADYAENFVKVRFGSIVK